MAPKRIVECSFLIPHHRDAEISDGERHAPQAWQWLSDEMFVRFEGMTIAPGVYKGVWKSSRTARPIHDQTRKFFVALPERDVKKLRSMPREACTVFDQQRIYLNVAGCAEFVEVKT